jgi:hypothetical protein
MPEAEFEDARSQPDSELSYRDGDPIPAGYALMPSKVHRRLLLGGILTESISYGLSVTAAVFGTYELFVPLVGPWLALRRDSRSNSDCNRSSGACDSVFSRQELLVSDGVLQAAGAALIVAGLLVPKYKLVLHDHIQVQMAPIGFGHSGYGFGAVGQF